MKRSKPMKRTAFKRKPTTTAGRTSDGSTFIAHGDRPLDAKGRAALQDVMEAASKQLARTPMRRRSKRMAEIYKGDEDHEGRAAFVARILQERPVCQVGQRILYYVEYASHDNDAAAIRSALINRDILDGKPVTKGELFVDYTPHIGAFCVAGAGGHRCGLSSVDVHELAKRSHTGSKRKREILTDPDNVLACCRACHDWIETHGKEAIALGLGKSRYAGRNA